MYLPVKQSWLQTTISYLTGFAILAVIFAITLLLLYFLFWGMILAAIIFAGFYVRPRWFGSKQAASSFNQRPNYSEYFHNIKKNQSDKINQTYEHDSD